MLSKVSLITTLDDMLLDKGFSEKLVRLELSSSTGWVICVKALPKANMILYYANRSLISAEEKRYQRQACKLLWAEIHMTTRGELFLLRHPLPESILTVHSKLNKHRGIDWFMSTNSQALSVENTANLWMDTGIYGWLGHFIYLGSSFLRITLLRIANSWKEYG